MKGIDGVCSRADTEAVPHSIAEVWNRKFLSHDFAHIHTRLFVRSLLVVAVVQPEDEFLFCEGEEPSNHLFVLGLSRELLLVNSATDRVPGREFNQVSHQEDIDFAFDTILDHSEKAGDIALWRTMVDITDEHDLSVVLPIFRDETLFIAS